MLTSERLLSLSQGCRCRIPLLSRFCTIRLTLGRSSEQASGEPSERDAPPGGRDAELNERLEASRAAWGALPARTRDALLQGSSDSFSSLYRHLTEDFYRRIAEDAR